MNTTIRRTVGRSCGAMAFALLLLVGVSGDAATQPNCSDPINTCRPRVKSLGEERGCACFACEAGTKAERRVCTSNPKDKETLYKMAKR